MIQHFPASIVTLALCHREGMVRSVSDLAILTTSNNAKYMCEVKEDGSRLIPRECKCVQVK